MTTANRWPAVKTVPFTPTHECLGCHRPVVQLGDFWFIEQAGRRKPHLLCKLGYVPLHVVALPKNGRKDK